MSEGTLTPDGQHRARLKRKLKSTRTLLTHGLDSYLLSVAIMAQAQAPQPQSQAPGFYRIMIDVVLLTHIHGDHSGGLTVDGKRNFPNAEVERCR